MARYVLIRQWVFWLIFLTTFTVNLWFGIWTASRSSPLTIVGDHHPTCCSQPEYENDKLNFNSYLHQVLQSLVFKDTNLNSTRNLISFNLCLNPFVDNKRPSCMNHCTWKEICKYLVTTKKKKKRTLKFEEKVDKTCLWKQN